MRNYRDLIRWVNNRQTTLQQLRQAAPLLGVQLPRGANLRQARASILRVLNANPGAPLPQNANAPWPQPQRQPQPQRNRARQAARNIQNAGTRAVNRVRNAARRNPRPRNPRPQNLQPATQSQNSTPIVLGVVITLLICLVLALGLSWFVSTFIAPARPPAPAVTYQIGQIKSNGTLVATSPVRYYLDPLKCDGCKYAWTAPDGNESNSESPTFTMGEGNKKVYVRVTKPDGTFEERNETFSIAQKAAASDPNAGRTSPTTSLLLVTAQKIIADHKGDELANATVDEFGKWCDRNELACPKSEVSNWTVTGPALLLTDPIGVDMTKSGFRVVKTYTMNSTFWGVYYCSDRCVSPKPGRAVNLSAPLP